MREIKFRAWKKYTQKYLKADELLINLNNGNLQDLAGGMFRPTDVVIEQYTGLKDKNGVEIYEGDIVKTFGKNIYVVEFFDGKFNQISDFKDGVWEVIGNVHENIDLLVDDIERMIPDDIGNDIHDFLHGGK